MISSVRPGLRSDGTETGRCPRRTPPRKQPHTPPLTTRLCSNTGHTAGGRGGRGRGPAGYELCHNKIDACSLVRTFGGVGLQAAVTAAGTTRSSLRWSSSAGGAAEPKRLHVPVAERFGPLDFLNSQHLVGPFYRVYDTIHLRDIGQIPNVARLFVHTIQTFPCSLQHLSPSKSARHCEDHPRPGLTIASPAICSADFS